MKTHFIHLRSALIIISILALLQSCSGEMSYEDAIARIEEKEDDPARRQDAKLLIDMKNHALAEQKLLDLGAKQGYSSAVVDLAKQSQERIKTLLEDLNDVSGKEDVKMPVTMSDSYEAKIESVSDADRAEFDAAFIRELKIANSQLSQMFFVNATEAGDPDIRAFAARKVEDVRAFTFKIEEVEKSLLTTVQQ